LVDKRALWISMPDASLMPSVFMLSRTCSSRPIRIGVP
jgi:hypothetical protein